MKSIRSFFTNASPEMDFIEKLNSFLVNQYKTVDLNHVRKGALHLDMWFDNIHIDKDNRITDFDFDFCGNGWLCNDIAYFLYQLHYTNINENDYKAKAERFLEGYESITIISEEEKKILPMATLGIMIFYLGIQCDKFDTWSNVFLNEDHLKRFTAAIKRWMGYHGVEIG